MLNSTSRRATLRARVGANGSLVRGSISIVGSVDLNHDGSIDAGDIINQTLVSGTMTSTTVLDTAGIFGLLISGSFSEINPTLLSYYGYSGPEFAPFAGSLNIQFDLSPGAVVGNAFSSTGVLSGDVAFTVPETSSTMFVRWLLLLRVEHLAFTTPSSFMRLRVLFQETSCFGEPMGPSPWASRLSLFVATTLP